MLEYSFSTVLMAVLSSNIIIIFMAACFCHKNTLVSIGYKMFALLLGITFLRIALPFQFSFTTNVTLTPLLSQAISFFRERRFVIGSFKYSMWNICEFIWLVGILVKMTKFIKDHLVFNHWVVWYGIDVTEEGYYSQLLDEICGDAPNPFCIIELQGLDVPMLYGVRHPRILIPIGMKMSESNLRYLFAHETAHHFHHDILIKTGINLLTIAYWWNPACYVLKAQLDAVLEMRIDDQVSGNTFDSIREYLKCLIFVADLGNDKTGKHIKAPSNTLSLAKARFFNNTVNRFHMMGETPRPYARLLHVFAFALTVSLCLLSYFFIFEARYATPKESMTTIDLSAPGTYAVINEDNTYSIYYKGYLLETVDSLEHYSEDTPVYNSIEEVPSEFRTYSE